jgi:hypothetical protein
MTDYPMIYSAPMVRALQAGIKTQTRRLSGLDDVNKNPGAWSLHSVGPLEYMAKPSVKGRFGATFESRDIEPGTLYVCPQVSPCAPGDRIWVKEAFRGHKGYNSYPPREWSHWPVHYHADGPPDPRDDAGENGRLRSPIHMPRWASRITLTVTDVRVQRVSEISLGDCYAEGCTAGKTEADAGVLPVGWTGPWDEYRALWNSINGPDAWARNAWVWAYSFSVHHGNIDSMERQ